MSSQESLTQIIVFSILGLIGGVTHVVVKAKSWNDLKKFSSFKRALLGGASGFIYHFLYSEQDFPNSVMAIASGYIGTDFIKDILERFQKGDEKG